MRASARSGSRPAWSSSTPRPCCMTTSSMPATCAAGAATANAVFGNEASVLVGDFLFSRAFQLMVEDGSLRVLEILSNAAAVIAEGRGGPAHHQPRHHHRRGRLSRRGSRQDRGPVRRRLPHRRGDRRAPGRRGGGAGKLRPQPRHRLPARRRRARLRGRAEGPGQDCRRRFPRGQDHPPGGAGLPPRQRRGARLLAPRPWRTATARGAISSARWP